MCSFPYPENCAGITRQATFEPENRAEKIKMESQYSRAIVITGHIPVKTAKKLVKREENSPKMSAASGQPNRILVEAVRWPIIDFDSIGEFLKETTCTGYQQP